MTYVLGWPHSLQAVREPAYTVYFMHTMHNLTNKILTFDLGWLFSLKSSSWPNLDPVIYTHNSQMHKNLTYDLNWPYSLETVGDLLNLWAPVHHHHGGVLLARLLPVGVEKQSVVGEAGGTGVREKYWGVVVWTGWKPQKTGDSRRMT